MRPGFSRGRRGRVLGRFSVPEGMLLRNLISQVVELVHEGASTSSHETDPLEAMFGFGAGPISAPEDPVLARLLPNAYADDEEAAGEFRRFTEQSLRDEKATNGLAVIADIEAAGLPADPEAALEDGGEDLELDLGSDQATAWLRALNDVRLALATRLGIEEGDEDVWDSLAEDDPRRYMHDVYDWLGYVQETLVQSLSE